jgi:fucose permease
MIMVLLSGAIIYVLGRKRTLLLFTAAFAIGFGGITITHSIGFLYLFIALTGMGWGLCNNIIHILITEASHGKATGITILHSTYAFGSFIGPLILNGVIMLGFDWKVAVLFVSFSALALFITFLLLKPNIYDNLDTPVQIPENETKTINFTFLKEARYYVCILLYFCYIGFEVCINTWLITFLAEAKIMSISTAQTMLSILWFIIIFGRLLNIVFSKWMERQNLLLLQCACLFFLMLILIVNRTELVAIILIPVIGFVMSGISPTNASNAREYIKGTGLASGIMFAGGCLGSTIVPYLMGYVAEKTDITISMFVIAFLLAFMVLLNILNTAFLKHSNVAK